MYNLNYASTTLGVQFKRKYIWGYVNEKNVISKGYTAGLNSIPSRSRG